MNLFLGTNEIPVFQNGILSMIKMATCAEIWRYKQDGFSQSATAKALQLNRRTVSKYWNMQPNEIQRIKRNRPSKLSPVAKEIEELYRIHQNCEVVLQELKKRGYETTTLRTLQRFTKPLRDQLNKARINRAKARQRVESAPGEYMQIDFGVKNVQIAGEWTKIHFFVAVLAYSRRRYVAWFENEDSDSWLRGIEGAFAHFGGVPKYIVCDNARALVTRTALPTRVPQRYFVPNERFNRFCHYWGVEVVACLPYYPQSKGKVENAVGYVKKNCLAGYSFNDVAQLQERLDYWMSEVADKKQMQLPTGEFIVPAERFEEEKSFLLPCRPSFLKVRELWRTVDAKGMLNIDKSRYQLPIDFSKKQVAVSINNQEMTVRYQGKVIAKLNKTLDCVQVNMISALEEAAIPEFGSTAKAGVLDTFEENSSLSINLREDYLDEYQQHKNNPLDRPSNYYGDIIGGSW